jgi:hypothetical protein
MTSELLLALAALAAAPATSADSGHCDSKPFTLKKPAAPAPLVAPPPKPKPVVAAKPAKRKTSKYVLGCKQAKN